MKIIIPNQQTKQLRQPNKGNLFGEIYGSWNLDLLSSPGSIKVNPAIHKIISDDTTDSGDSDIGDIWGFVRTNADGIDRWWAGSDSVLFKTTDTTYNDSWQQDADTAGDGTPTNMAYNTSDMVIWEGSLVVSSATDLHKLTTTWDQSWWDTTLAQVAMTSGVYHPLNVWERNLLIGDDNKMHLINSSAVVSANRLTLPTEYTIIKIINRIDKIWLLTQHKYEGDALIFEWDGTSTTYTNFYSVKAPKCLSGIVSKNGIAYVMNNHGQLLEYNGSGFEECARLPLFNENIRRTSGGTSQAIWDDAGAGRILRPNGMCIINDRIHILLSGSINSIYGNFEHTPSGIWIYDKEIGLYHAFSFKNSNKSLTYEYGYPSVNGVGAIIPVKKNTFLAGGLVNIGTEGAGTIRKVIGTIDLSNANPPARSGYVIYSRILSSDIQNYWQKIWVKFNKLLSTSNKIVLKYRTNLTSTIYGAQADITWTNTTTFTSTDADITANSIGQEIFVRTGANAGLTAHITSFTAGASNTITIDETALVGTGTSTVYLYEWKKLGTINDTNSVNLNYADLAIPGPSTFIDIKAVMFFTDERESIDEVIITTKTNQKSE